MSRVMVVVTSAYIGDKKEPKLVAETVNERKHSERDTNVVQRKATRHEDRLVKIGNFMKDKDTRLIWESTPQSGFQPSNGEHLKPIEQKIQEEVSLNLKNDEDIIALDESFQTRFNTLQEKQWKAYAKDWSPKLKHFSQILVFKLFKI